MVTNKELMEKLEDMEKKQASSEIVTRLTVYFLLSMTILGWSYSLESPVSIIMHIFSILIFILFVYLVWDSRKYIFNEQKKKKEDKKKAKNEKKNQETENKENKKM